MKDRNTRETAIICAAVVSAVALLMVPFEVAGGSGGTKGPVVITFLAVLGTAVVSAFRYLTVRKRAQLEQTGGQQYRQLADEYRRLSDLAITAQEHTDLKLGDVAAHLDYLREQTDSLQKILKEVE